MEQPLFCRLPFPKVRRIGNANVYTAGRESLDTSRASQICAAEPPRTIGTRNFEKSALESRACDATGLSSLEDDTLPRSKPSPVANRLERAGKSWGARVQSNASTGAFAVPSLTRLVRRRGWVAALSISLGKLLQPCSGGGRAQVGCPAIPLPRFGRVGLRLEIGDAETS
jgi:hypothetical protein